MDNTVERLKHKIASRDAVIGVVGVGYVGLPLCVEMGRVGFRVIGFEVNEAKVDALNRGVSYIGDVSDTTLRPLVDEGRLEATSDFSRLSECDAISICVPTPLNKTKDPDVSYVVKAAEAISAHLHPGTLVVLESTTYPGTTRDLVLPLLARSGYEVGKEFFLAFSPERVDPGQTTFTIRNTPKVMGGVTPVCTEVATQLYGTFIDQVVPVSSTEVAETVKLLENTFRAVNIALVNETAIICRKLGLDVWEVIDAAATKPFGFMPFYPGPGLGGHCLPIDPLYLSWLLKSLNYNARFIELASDINGKMPYVVVDIVGDALNEQAKAFKGSRILVLGVAYKRDISDIRESPALDIIAVLQDKHADVAYHDPYVPEITVGNRTFTSQPIDGDHLEAYDCVVITTDHRCFDYQDIVDRAKMVVDTRNATRLVTRGREKIRKL